MSNITIEQNNDKFRGVWLPNTFYRQDDMVFDGTSLWVALADFTSGATFDAVNWFCPSCGISCSLDPDSNSEPIDMPLIDCKETNKQRSVTTYIYGMNRHATGYHYMEVKALGTSLDIGLNWDNSTIAHHSNGCFFNVNNGYYYLTPAVLQGNITPWVPIAIGDVFRMWLRDNKLWVGWVKGGVPTVYGDPVGGTGNILTLPTGVSFRFYIRQYYAGNIIYNAKSSDIEYDPLGATPFED